MKTPGHCSFDVFLNHSARGHARVQRLAERLRAAGARVWEALRLLDGLIPELQKRIHDQQAAAPTDPTAKEAAAKEVDKLNYRLSLALLHKAHVLAHYLSYLR